jgi:hypothetical protein
VTGGLLVNEQVPRPAVSEASAERIRSYVPWERIRSSAPPRVSAWPKTPPGHQEPYRPRLARFA